MPGFQKRLLFYCGSFALWFLILFMATGGGADLPWLSGWHHWDAEWYERIWREGYTSDPQMMAFPPGYSWIVGLLCWFVGSFDLAALLINLTAFFASAIFVTEFCARRFTISHRAFFVFFLATPLAFYTFSVYSDALFMALFWLALIVACQDPSKMSRGEKWRAALLLFCIPWVRLTGYALFIWILFRRWFVFSVLVALAIWLGINVYFYHDFLHFLHMQQLFAMPKGGITNGLREVYFSLVYKNPYRLPMGNVYFWFQIAFLPTVSMILLLLASGWLAWKNERLLALTILSVMLFSRNQAFWRSVFRYDWPLMPLLSIPLLYQEARAPERGPALRSTVFKYLRWTAFWILTGICFCIQIVFAIRMHQGRWTF